MSTWREIFWWLVFLPVALWLQSLVIGLDVLLVGFIIMLQERYWKTLPWFVSLCIAIQEGTGTLTFGGSALWYLATFFLFLSGRRWFKGCNFSFVFILSLALCPIGMGIMVLMTSLQEISIDLHILLGRSIVQAFFLPIMWLLAMWTRHWGEIRVSP